MGGPRARTLPPALLGGQTRDGRSFPTLKTRARHPRLQGKDWKWAQGYSLVLPAGAAQGDSPCLCQGPRVRGHRAAPGPARRGCLLGIPFARRKSPGSPSSVRGAPAVALPLGTGDTGRFRAGGRRLCPGGGGAPLSTSEGLGLGRQHEDFRGTVQPRIIANRFSERRRLSAPHGSASGQSLPPLVRLLSVCKTAYWWVF